MNTTIKVTIVAVVIIAALAILGAGFAFAQTATPWGGYGPGYGMMGGNAYQNGTPVPGYGYGMMGSQGMMSGVDVNAMHQWMSTTGGAHTLVWNGLAEALKLSPEELNAQLASGKTLAQIAEAQGVTQEQLAAALEASVKAGLDKAVADGVLTQAQADQMLSYMGGNFGWMITHMGNFGGGFGPGGCHGNFVPQNNS